MKPSSLSLCPRTKRRDTAGFPFKPAADQQIYTGAATTAAKNRFEVKEQAATTPSGCPMFAPAYVGRKRLFSNVFTPGITNREWLNPCRMHRSEHLASSLNRNIDIRARMSGAQESRLKL
jgi:hypothetical protein